MKKFILLVGLLLCLCSCTVDTNLWHIEITYRIDGSEPKTTAFEMAFQSGYVPVYVYQCHYEDNELYVHGESRSMDSARYRVIYKGPLRIDVVDFKYEPVRSYKSSIFTGREVRLRD